MGNKELPPRPKIALFDCQSAHEIDLTALQKCADSSLPLCLSSPSEGNGHPALPGLETVEISFVDDAEIARVHDQFMAVPGATDVITFDHGEIVISTETAARQATEYGHDLHRELALYIIHGLLHLNGHEDHTGRGADHMRTTQERILETMFQRDTGSVPPMPT